MSHQPKAKTDPKELADDFGKVLTLKNGWRPDARYHKPCENGATATECSTSSTNNAEMKRIYHSSVREDAKACKFCIGNPRGGNAGKTIATKYENIGLARDIRKRIILSDEASLSVKELSEMTGKGREIVRDLIQGDRTGPAPVWLEMEDVGRQNRYAEAQVWVTDKGMANAKQDEQITYIGDY
jgi:hypothetical protein